MDKKEIQTKAYQFYESGVLDSASIYYQYALEKFSPDANTIEEYIKVGEEFGRIDSFKQAAQIYNFIIHIDSREKIDPINYKYLKRIEKQFIISGKAPKFIDPFILYKYTLAENLLSIEYYYKYNFNAINIALQLLNYKCIDFRNPEYRSLYSSLMGYKAMNENLNGRTKRAIRILIKSINQLNKYDWFGRNYIEDLRDIILQKYGNNYIEEELANARIRIKMEPKSKSSKDDVQGIKKVKIKIFNQKIILPNFHKRYEYILYNESSFYFSEVYKLPTSRHNRLFCIRQKGIQYSHFSRVMLRDEILRY